MKFRYLHYLAYNAYLQLQNIIYLTDLKKLHNFLDSKQLLNFTFSLIEIIK